MLLKRQQVISYPQQAVRRLGRSAVSGMQKKQSANHPAGGGRRWRQGPAWRSHGGRSSARSRCKLVATIQPISAPARSAVRSLLQAQPHPCSLRLFNTWSLCAPSSRAGELQAAESAAKALASGSGSRTDGCSSCRGHLQLALLLQPSHTWGCWTALRAASAELALLATAPAPPPPLVSPASARSHTLLTLPAVASSRHTAAGARASAGW